MQYGVKYTLTLSDWEEATKQNGKTFLEWSGTTKIKIAADTLKDQYNNTSNEQEFSLGHIDLIQPRIEIESTSKDETAKTETIIFNVVDKYINTSSVMSADSITVTIDDEETTGITKTLSRVPGNDKTALVNGSSKVVAQQYKLVLSNFEKQGQQ